MRILVEVDPTAAEGRWPSELASEPRLAGLEEAAPAWLSGSRSGSDSLIPPGTKEGSRWTFSRPISKPADRPGGSTRRRRRLVLVLVAGYSAPCPARADQQARALLVVAGEHRRAGRRHPLGASPRHERAEDPCPGRAVVDGGHHLPLQLGSTFRPILAGAGNRRLAMGFGAQHLVRDVIAGFFL